ncbi:large ribosomal subunit protein bL17m-like [Ylistrum balloti]|uniref:large ribosomal subunit protein bL17m-like n=1 Tax=Ylistrum balloti TaxID=509963 RepID=UPI002905CD1A|nr:large ribosomal subunit protein bL17m-like [Ylistrum balloti]
MLRSAAYRKHPRKLQRASGRDGGPQGRVQKLQEMVTKLIRYERIESTLPKCDEARGYTEQLINLAVEKGDQDKHAMEMADYWLTEKDLIHKLFKVLAPRYSHMKNFRYTQMYRLPIKYPGTDNTSPAVLELKGNPWPPVVPNQNEKKFLLTNILLKELFKEKQARGEVNPRQNLDRIIFPDDYENEDMTAGDDEIDSDVELISTKSEEQLASTESSENLSEFDEKTTESDEELASVKSREQSDINVDKKDNADDDEKFKK